MDPRKLKVLVVCHGSINRSPACAAVLNTYPHIEARARALKEYGTKDGRSKATKKIREAMAAHGYDLSAHRAYTASHGDVQWADGILYMDGGNFKRFEQRFVSTAKLSCLAGRIGEHRIADPNFLKGDDPKFQEIVQKIIEASRNYAESLQ